MNQSLSKEKEEAQMIEASDSHDLGKKLEMQTFAERSYQSETDELPKEFLKEMPRMPKRIATCYGCGSQLQTT
eukprot:616954-Karenia_brevis.AAC.1